MRILVREQQKKTLQQQTNTPATYGFCLDFVDTFVGKCNGAQARRGWRGRGEPTIIIIKEIIRFNNNNSNNNNNNNNNHLTQGPPRFLLTRVFFRRAPHPPIVGGVYYLKSPLLPPYPAIPPYVVRTPHPGITDDQAQKTGLQKHLLLYTSFLDPYISAMTKQHTQTDAP